MQTIPVVFKNAEVLNYNPRDDMVEFRVVINDGKDKAVVRRCKIADPEQLAAEVLNEVRTKLKEAHRHFTLDDDPLAGVVNVKFEQEIDEVESSLAKFLASVHNSVRSAKLSKLSYLDMERKVKGLKAEF
ncbi:hypothetical protein HY642_01415 [Candidatus Woesearchaeota archaeon]|nr:hypothetical protein [Candidatus Woesearchaeota archaeon]